MSLVTLNQEEFTIKIENVDMTDEGQYVCAVQTSSRPRTTSVYILVQGNKTFLDEKDYCFATYLGVNLCICVLFSQ